MSADPWRLLCALLDLAVNVAVWLTRVGWRFRAGLVPLWTALAVLVTGRLLSNGWWWAPITVALAGAPGLYWWGEHLSAGWQRTLAWFVPEGLDDGRRGVLDRRTERGYLALVLLATSSWVSWIASHPWTDTSWLWVFALAGGIPWWWHRGWRRRQRPNRWVRRWRHVGDHIREFEGSRVVSHSGDQMVTELHVRLRPGLTVNHVGDRGLQVASALSPRLRPGAVTLSEGRSARAVTVRIVPRDPWQGIVPHPLPPFASVDLSRDDRVMVGRLEDRRVLLHKMRQHTLLVAKSGAGKSVMLDALIGWMVLARAPKVAIDMASGVSLGDWAATLAAPLATNVAEALQLLRGVMNVVEYREQWMREQRVKQWPGEDLFVVIDEFPTLTRLGGKQMIALLTILAERARKTGVWLYPAAQNGTKDDLGSTEFRGQMMCTLGGRLDKHMNTILWGDATKQGWDGTSLQTGTWLLKDPSRDVPRVAKGVFLDPAAQGRLVTEASRPDNRAPLDAGSARALAAAPDMPAGVDEVRGAASDQPRRVTVLESARSPLDELDGRVLAELPGTHQSGVGAQGIADQLGVDRGKVERSLRRLERAGSARHLGGRDGWVHQ